MTREELTTIIGLLGNMRIEWDAGDVVDGTVEAVDAYVLKEEDG